MRLTHKQTLFTLVAELHRAGIQTATGIARVLRISDTYARRVLRELGLAVPPRSRDGLLEMLDTDLRTRVHEFSSEKQTERQAPV